jgi:hypothetical protein
MVEALVITPVIVEEVLRSILAQLNIKSNDVIATASPLKDLASHIQEGAVVNSASIGGQLLDASKLSIEAHSPSKVVFLLPSGHTDGALEQLGAFRSWTIEQGFCIPVGYQHIDGRLPLLRTIGMTCIDWRLSAALSKLEPKTTGWLRLPGVEAAFADPLKREVIFSELSRATDGAVLSRSVDVRVDPHQDCAARKMKHRTADHDDASWYAEDLAIMQREHEACQKFLKGLNINRTNPSLKPVRAFGRSGEQEFELRRY